MIGLVDHVNGLPSSTPEHDDDHGSGCPISLHRRLHSSNLCSHRALFEPQHGERFSPLNLCRRVARSSSEARPVEIHMARCLPAGDGIDSARLLSHLLPALHASSEGSCTVSTEVHTARCLPAGGGIDLRHHAPTLVPQVCTRPNACKLAASLSAHNLDTYAVTANQPAPGYEVDHDRRHAGATASKN